jgi:hypothetical protein
MFVYHGGRPPSGRNISRSPSQKGPHTCTIPLPCPASNYGAFILMVEGWLLPKRPGDQGGHVVLMDPMGLEKPVGLAVGARNPYACCILCIMRLYCACTTAGPGRSCRRLKHFLTLLRSTPESCHETGRRNCWVVRWHRRRVGVGTLPRRPPHPNLNLIVTCLSVTCRTGHGLGRPARVRVRVLNLFYAGADLFVKTCGCVVCLIYRNSRLQCGYII